MKAGPKTSFRFHQGKMMLHSSPFIFDLALIMVVAGVVTLICKFIKQPLILGYLVAGLFVGPHFPFIPTVTEISSIETWAEFGVIFLLFILGFDFTFKKLWNVGSAAMLITFVKTLAMFSVGSLFAFIFKLPANVGIFMGAVLSITSTIIVAKALSDEHLTHHSYSSIIMGILVLEDILVLFLILFLSSIGSSQSLSGQSLFLIITSKILFFLFVFLLSIYLPRMISKIRTTLTKEMILILSLAFCLLISMLSSKVGLSPALGAFVAGMLLSGTTESSLIKKLIQPIRDLFVAIFFISIGMMINPDAVIKNWHYVLVLSFFMIFAKGLSTIVAALLTKTDLLSALSIGVFTIPIGEFSFVISTIGISLQLIDPDFYSVTIVLSAISILASNNLAKFIPKERIKEMTMTEKRI